MNGSVDVFYTGFCLVYEAAWRLDSVTTLLRGEMRRQHDKNPARRKQCSVNDEF